MKDMGLEAARRMAQSERDKSKAARERLREQFAGMAMQGLLSNPQNDSMEWHEWAHDAVGMADALIAELEKKNG